jgi:hypothetical protein
MPPIIDIMAGSNRVGLAKAIQKAVLDFTKLHPMPPDEVIATLAFCVGTSIGTQPEASKRHLAELAIKFLEDGDGIASETKAPTSGLIDIRGLIPN